MKIAKHVTIQASLIAVSLLMLPNLSADSDAPRENEPQTPPRPLGHWNLDAIEDGRVISVDGEYGIKAGSLKVVPDDRRKTVLQFSGENIPGLMLPDGLREKLTGDTMGATFFLNPTRHAKEAIWQPILTFNPTANWREKMEVLLRWNRMITRPGKPGFFEMASHKQTLEPNWWTHVALIRDKDGVQLYLDGVKCNRIDTIPADYQSGIMIGSGIYGGRIHQLRIYGRALTEAEIKAIISADSPIDEGGDLPAPNVPDETIAELGKRNRYMNKEMKDFFPKIEDWKKYDKSLDPAKPAELFARDRFKAPPKPGVHPRVWFNPEDIPAIRDRLKTNHLARVNMELIRGRLLQLSPNQENWENIPYDSGKFSQAYPEYLEKGLRINRLMGYRGPWLGGWIDDLAEGQEPEALKGAWDKNPTTVKRQYLMHLLPYAAFRALIDDDRQEGRRLAGALTTICNLQSRHLDELGPQNLNWQSVYWTLSSDSIGMSYDWLYNFMTPAQRKVVRRFISQITTNKTFVGLDHLPAFPGNTTNWIILHMNLMPLTLSIEGEEGFDEKTYCRCVEGMRKWVYVASGPDGAPFEGFKKSSYSPHWLIPLAKRGANFLGTEWCKNHIRKYQLACMAPNARNFIFETGIFSTPTQPATFKYAYPDDPVIDLLFGNAMEEKFKEDYFPAWQNVRTTYAPIWAMVMVNQDPKGVTPEGKYDYDQRVNKVFEKLRRENEPLDYFSDYRGLMTARTAWDRNATYLFFEPRNVPGGHTWASRNDFVLASHGRLWSFRPISTEGLSPHRSLILIDGKGQGHQTLQGRTVDYQASDQGAFCTGDATWAYTYKAGKPGFDKAVPVTPNQSRLEPCGLPWMDKPWAFLPGWLHGIKGGRRHGVWAEYNPVKHAYRAVGLIRGKHPFVVVADELQKDETEHQYDWLMQIPMDVVLLSKTTNADGTVDMLLGEDTNLSPEPRTEGKNIPKQEKKPQAFGKNRLLLRVLAAGDGGIVAACLAEGAKIDPFVITPKNKVNYHHQRIFLPLKAVRASYRVLLYPHLEGDKLPRTQLRNDTLTVDFGDEKKVVTFAKNSEGAPIMRAIRLFKQRETGVPQVE